MSETSTGEENETVEPPKPQAEQQKSSSTSNPIGTWEEFSITLVKSGLVGLYLSAILFIIGWAYADRYFELFGISLSGLERDLDGAFYVYALWALRDGWCAFAIASLSALVLIAVLLFAYARVEPFWRPTAIFVIAGIVMLSFVGAFRLGQSRANDQVPKLIAKEYQTFPRVLVQPKPGTATADFLAARTESPQKDCLRKLYMDKKNLYLYPGYESLRKGIPPVYMVPLSEIAAIEISKNRELCQL